MSIAKTLNKKVAVITDNDGKQSNLDYFEEKNNESEYIQIFADEDLENWTWEVCMYNLNENNLLKIVDVQKNSEYSFKGENYKKIPVLGKMLNNKTDCAMLMLDDMEEFEYDIPNYIEEALEWIRD